MCYYWLFHDFLDSHILHFCLEDKDICAWPKCSHLVETS